MKPYINTNVVIIIPNYWAKDETIEKTWRKLRGIAGQPIHKMKDGPHNIYVAHDTEAVQVSVDGMGSICYHEDHPPHLIHQHTTEPQLSELATKHHANAETLALQIRKEFNHCDEDELHSIFSDDMIDQITGVEWEEAMDATEELADLLFPEGA